MSREAQRETELLHSRLRDIAQAVINDDQAAGAFINGGGGSGCCIIDEKLVISNGMSSPLRSRSPIRRTYTNGSRPNSRNGSPFADATFSAVQAALNKRQLQVILNKNKKISEIRDS